jgi:hypothetical protein
MKLVSNRFSILCAVLGLASFLNFSAQAQLVGFDTAANYSGISTGTNAGTGFGPWTVTTGTGGFAGIFVGDPASAGISGLPNPSFGMYANPAGQGAAVFASRSFSNALAADQTFSLRWAVHWDADTGGKGFRLFSGGTNGTQLAHVRQAGFPGNITFQSTSNSVATNAITNFGTGPMTWTFKMTDATTLQVSSTPRDGSTNTAFSTNLTVSAAPDAVLFYATNMSASDNRQPYFNNLMIYSGAQPPVTTALTFSVNMNTRIQSGGFNTNSVGGDKVTVDWGSGFPPSNYAYLTDDNNDGIYTGTVSITDTVGANVPFRFTIEPNDINAALISETAVSRSFVMPISATTIPSAFFENIEGNRQVTFRVDMGVQEQMGNFNPATHGVQVRGNFNGWSANNPLTREGTTSIYSTTVAVNKISGQSLVFKYFNDIPAVADDGLEYESATDRSVAITLNSDGAATPAQVLDVVFFNNLSAVPQTRPVTFAVNMSRQISLNRFNPATDFVEIRGGMNAWGGGTTWRLTDGDSDGIYTATFNIEGAVASSIGYKFFASGVAGWEADPNRNLVLEAVQTPQDVPVVFFSNDSGATRQVTFAVDMSIQQALGNFNPATGTVQLRGLGSFDATDKVLTREGETSIFKGTFAVAGDAGTSVSYKFFSTGVTESGFEIINPNDLFENRSLTLLANGTPMVLDPVFFSNQSAVPPSALSYTPSTISGTVGTAISSLTPAVTGTVTNWSVNPALPAGISISTTTGVISGTPTAVSASASYTVTATNGTGSTTATVTIEVAAAPEGSTFAGAYPGASMTDVAPNGLTYLANYAFGGDATTQATLPVQDTSDPTKLRLVVVFRTDDSTLPLSALGGETTADLAGVWSASGVSVENSTDVSPVPPNTVRKVISVDRGSDPKKFLRATVTK